MMKRLGLLSLSLVVGLALVAAEADARRMGGGGNLGMQRSVPQSRLSPTPTPGAQATPAPVAPAAQAAPRAAPPAAAPAAPRSGMSRWLGPIAGIAAGLGLAALLSHMGLSPDFGGILLMLLLAGAAFFIFRAFMRRRAGATPALEGPRAAWSGSDASQAAQARAEPRMSMPSIPPSVAASTQASAAALPGTASPASALPADFDAEGFLREAKRNFNRVQAAYDKADRRVLADVMTPEMFSEVQNELDRRSAHQPTEIVQLDGEVVEVVTEADRHIVSVRFHGLAREDGGELPQPFEEVWHLVKPVDDSRGWMLAGVQQLQTAH